MNELLKKTLAKREQIIGDLGFNKSSFDLLHSYLQLLWSANEELNLISRKMTEEELVDNHVVDCLLPLKYFPTHVKVVADFGSGGGLPGVLYAIQFPKIEFKLYEKSHLKQKFLLQCTEIAPNLRVQGDITLNLNGVDLVTARAFKPVDVILQISRDYYQKGGKYFLLKGRREKIEEELLLARKKFRDLKVAIEPLASPVLEVERHLIQI